jgi:hypothetical protein
VGFDIRDGRLALKTGYTLEWGPERHVLRVADGAISVRTLVLGIPGIAQPKVELPEADITGIEMKAVARTARVEGVVLRNAVIRARRNADGLFDLEQMRPPKKAGPPPKEKSDPFHWTVGKVELASRPRPPPSGRRSLFARSAGSNPASGWPSPRTARRTSSAS